MRGDWGPIPGDGYLGLLIGGLPVGQYIMSSWHYDADLGSNETNWIQIEINNSTDPVGTGDVVIDNFSLQPTAASYWFWVTEPGQTKRIIFRGDGNEGQSLIDDRVRLNGFTITTIPEPAGLALTAIGVVFASSLRRQGYGGSE